MSARTRTRYVPMDNYPDTFVIQDHAGSTVVCPGRVARFGDTYWGALGIGASAWTRLHLTRAAAVRDMRAGRTGVTP